ncbi:FAD binding domain-containing protein [Alkaliphilus peptidifermentans]|uniref:FAD binding domain-containing protein n=1 Tax=Alkaliphilus peptidifermentans TaxID=426129 RepID=UPI000B84919D|nr:FAD binding domain-containing protein [Alkaliphilus peptidifermentans]
MITIKNYVVPQTVEEAYGYLTSNKASTIFGGGAFIRMGSKNISTAIDLSKCGLNNITESDDSIEIGAMVTFGDLESSTILKNHFNNLLAISVKDIVGIQMRNIVTVGGTVYSRYGFSDFITALMVLDAKVKLHKGGLVPIELFITDGSKEKDILEYITIKKDNRRASFKSMRNSKGDYAILNIAVSKKENMCIAVGARPGRAILAKKTMEYINENGINLDNLEEALDVLTEEVKFGSNSRGSSQYREKICRTLIKRALKEADCLEA